MLSQIFLLSLVGLVAHASPAKELASRSIVIPGALDRGMTLSYASMSDITPNTTSTVLEFQVLDLLTRSSNGVNKFSVWPASCTIELTNFEYKDGQSTIDLPNPGEYQPCGSHAKTFQFKFSAGNSGNGFWLTVSHTININNTTPALIRTAKFGIPALLNWTPRDVAPFSGAGATLKYLYLPFDIDMRSNILTLTDEAPAGWQGDNYNIDPKATPTVYDREVEHKDYKDKLAAGLPVQYIPDSARD